MKPPICIDLYCGLGGWTEGFLAEGWRVVGFDIERHRYGDERYPGDLVLQDVLTLHGSQFKDVDCIVASPPCQQYLWLAMPWSRSKSEHSQAAKALRRKWESEGPDNRLFNACSRIQREASYARRLELRCCRLNFEDRACPRCHIPLIVENVRGAQPWVGKAAWSYGSFYLWGDVPALMPFASARKVPIYSDPRRNGGRGVHLTSPRENTEGLKNGGDWFGAGADCSPQCSCWSRSNARKAASAQIAKIPLVLAQHIAWVYDPRRRAA